MSASMTAMPRRGFAVRRRAISWLGGSASAQKAATAIVRQPDNAKGDVDSPSNTRSAVEKLVAQGVKGL